ncbi:MAG: fold protein [Firmicutes bacterium]|nr:fold protein [Bacillota bacterium]
MIMNEKMLELVEQIANLGFFEWDLTTGRFCCSDQVYKQVGLTPQSNTPSPDWFLHTVHPEDLELMRAKFINPPATGISETEYRAVRPDGSIVWLHLRICSVLDPSCTSHKKIGTLQDITNRKKHEIELKELAECLTQITNTLRSSQRNDKMAQTIAKLGYFEWNITKRKIFWSEQQYINFGYTPQQFTPSTALFRRHLHPDDVKKLNTALRNIPPGKYAETEFRIVNSTGSVTWLHARATVITAPQGNPGILLGITQDITEKKLTEERIKKAEKELIFINQLNTRSDYLNRLLTNDYPPEYSSKALNEFGIESQTSYCCFVIQTSDKTAHPSGDETAETSTIMQKVLIWLAGRGYDKIWSLHNNIIFLMPIIDERLASPHSQLAFSANLSQAIQKHHPSFSVIIGISGVSGIPFNIKEVYEKASRAAIVATANSASPILHFDDIGLYDIAFQLIKDKTITALANNTIGRLAKYDQIRGGNLLLTLKYILEDECLKTVAKKLYIHPNTAIWRKRRIEELLSLSLDKTETKVTLMLHLKIWELQHISNCR